MYYMPVLKAMHHVYISSPSAILWILACLGYFLSLLKYAMLCILWENPMWSHMGGGCHTASVLEEACMLCWGSDPVYTPSATMRFYLYALFCGNWRLEVYAYMGVSLLLCLYVPTPGVCTIHV